MDTISFQDFQKLEMRVGKIVKVERVPETEKLFKMQVDIGKKTIQIVTSLIPYYTEEELDGKTIIVLVNLEPAKFKGELSEGMLLCAEDKEKDTCVLLTTEKSSKPGTLIT